MLECSKYKLWPISVAIRSGINVSFFGYRGMTLNSLTPRGYTPTELSYKALGEIITKVHNYI